MLVKKRASTAAVNGFVIASKDRTSASLRQARSGSSPLESCRSSNPELITGNKDETMKHLEEGLRMRDPNMANIQNDPLFDFFHSDPRYQMLVKKNRASTDAVSGSVTGQPGPSTRFS